MYSEALEKQRTKQTVSLRDLVDAKPTGVVLSLDSSPNVGLNEYLQR